MSGTLSDFGRTNVSGPGNNASINFLALPLTSAVRSFICSRVATCAISGLSAGRRLASNILETTRWADVSKQQIKHLAQQIAQGSYEVRGKSTFKEEFVTAGGVRLDEVNFKTFESKLLPNLYFAGEVLDIDAITGGFNFQAAWSGAWTAGKAMAF